MARHLTWCLKRTFILSNNWSSLRQRCMSIGKSDNLAILAKLPQLEEINVDYDEPKDFGEFLQDSKCSKIVAITTLTKILDVTKANAKKAVEQYPAFGYVPTKSIYKNYQILREAGVYKSTIKDNKFLLTDSTDDLKKKISLTETIDVDPNDVIHMFHLTVPVLASFAQRSKMEVTYYLPNGNRILYLAEKLDCEVGKICHLMSYNPHMLSLPAPKLLTITEFLLESGVAPEHIVNDFHVYNYNIGTIRDKIKRAKKLGMRPLKPWVLRCTKEIWEKAAVRHSQREIILDPDRTVQEHLAELFECDIKSVNYVTFKDPTLLTMNLDKLMKTASLIRSEGYTIEDIQRSPRIMHRSYKTLKELFDLWRKTGLRSQPLFKFLYSEEKFSTLLKIGRSTGSKVKKT